MTTNEINEIYAAVIGGEATQQQKNAAVQQHIDEHGYANTVKEIEYSKSIIYFGEVMDAQHDFY